jgi:hypothetical protein
VRVAVGVLRVGRPWAVGAEAADEVLAEQIRTFHVASRHTYGAPRVFLDLRDAGRAQTGRADHARTWLAGRAPPFLVERAVQLRIEEVVERRSARRVRRVREVAPATHTDPPDVIEMQMGEDDVRDVFRTEPCREEFGSERAGDDVGLQQLFEGM